MSTRAKKGALINGYGHFSQEFVQKNPTYNLKSQTCQHDKTLRLNGFVLYFHCSECVEGDWTCSDNSCGKFYEDNLVMSSNRTTIRNKQQGSYCFALTI